MLSKRTMVIMTPTRLLRAMISLVLLLPALSEAQTQYEWSVYSALNNVQDVAFDSAGGAWAATTGGVYVYRPAADSFQVFRTTEGLATLSSSAVAIGPRGRIYVGAVDGSLSIRELDGSWRALTEIAQFDRPDRRIHGFAFHDGNALVLTAFGVAVLRTGDMTFRDTWSQLGTIPRNSPVYDAVLSRDTFWLATGYGIAAAPAGGKALSDPRYWTVYDGSAGLGSLRVRSLAVVGGDIVAATDSGAWTLRDGRFERRQDLPTEQPANLAYTPGHLVATSLFYVYRYDGERFTQTTLSRTLPIRDITVAPDGRVAVAVRGESNLQPTEQEGMALEQGDSLVVLQADAPISNVFSDLAVARDGSLWAASAIWGSSPGVSALTGEKWKTFTRSSHPGELDNGAQTVGTGGDGNVWAGTWGAGVLRFRIGDAADGVDRFDTNEAPVWGYRIVGDIAADPFNGRTWIVNYNPESNLGSMLMVRLGEEEAGMNGTRFLAFDAPTNPVPAFRSIAVDQAGTKWIASQGHSGRTPELGLYYFNENGTIEIKTDDTWGVLLTSDGLLSNMQTALAVDRDGALWIGTADGLNVLDNPGTVLSMGSDQASIRSIRALRSVLINSIAVDALNRKWIGTNQGVFVLSADGVDVVERFTKSNSPLVANDVLSIATDPASGAVYMGTANGLSMVETPAVESTPEPEEIAIWPQPFVVPASEPARLSGLPSGAVIKILTPRGTLVHQFDSPGGAVAYWDGTADGEPVASGVYIIAAGSPTGGDTVLGKIAVVRR